MCQVPLPLGAGLLAGLVAKDLDGPVVTVRRCAAYMGLAVEFFQVSRGRLKTEATTAGYRPRILSMLDVLGSVDGGLSVAQVPIVDTLTWHANHISCRINR